MSFNKFKKAIDNRFSTMAEVNLFKTNVDKDVMWLTYLGAFPEGSNPIFRERTEHDCQCCKQFIRAAGNVVSIIGNKLVSIWDVDVGGDYQAVADAMAAFVKSEPVKDTFLHFERNLGTDFNHQELEDGKVKKWDHFHFELPLCYTRPKDSIASNSANFRTTKEVCKRGLDEISIEAMETVLELISQGSVYRGDEFKNSILSFLAMKRDYGTVKPAEQDNFCWTIKDPVSRIRNTAIGTLLIDVSEGMELDIAVHLFGSKMDNYKRPVTPIVSKAQVKKAHEKCVELGIEESLGRRHAEISDITINNVLFADRTAKQAMEGVFDELAKEIGNTAPKNLDKVEEVSITTFLKEILPKASTIELLLDNKHENNLMSLIASINADAKPIFKWGNNFSWTYNGEATDSMRERVAKAGGRVDGVLRFSIQWNDGDNNQNDFDAHCIEPNGNIIYFGRKNNCATGGNLDVDITNPGNKVAVENITWQIKNEMEEGVYEFLVHNYNHNGGKTGFTAEIEYEGKIHSYAYDKELRNNEKVQVALLEFSKEYGIKFRKSLSSSSMSKDIWNLKTCQFHRVSTVMNSPNHWDGEETGNKHTFFILEDCLNPEKARGFFNEFLDERLRDHRKVFEVLGSRMRAEYSGSQISGLGFSSTKRNQVVCKVAGAFSRIIKINF